MNHAGYFGIVLLSAIFAGCPEFPPYECTRCFDAAEIDAGLADSGDAENDAGELIEDAGILPRAVSLGRGLADKHSCAIGDDRSLWCWGDNSRGQLGITAARAFRPHKVLDGADEVVIGFEHTCVRRDSSVWCFGSNTYGQLGIGRTVSSISEPEQVLGLDDVVQLAAGTSHACALLRDGRVYCWGEALPNEALRYSPQELLGTPPDVSFIEAGTKNSGMLAAGELWMVGANAYVLGDGTTEARLTPVRISLPLPVVDLDIGDLHACAVLADSSVRCWGLNGEGSLGMPRENNASRPTELVPPLSGATAISCGFRNSCVITTSSTARCWGPNGLGVTGSTPEPEPMVYITPQLVLELEAPEELEIYWQHACALSAGTVRCWGRGEFGQIGNNTLTTYSHPVLVWPY